MSLGRQSILAAAAFSLATATFAGSVCYEQSQYPAVLRIEATPDGFRAYGVSPDHEKALAEATELRKRFGWNPRDPGPAYTIPVIAYHKQKGFSLEPSLTCHTDRPCEVIAARPPSCASALPPPERLIDDAVRAEPSLVKKPLDHTISVVPRDNDIDQKYGACAVRDGSTWFGIRYYDGEGTTGIGGVGRYDPKTKRLEIRRPEALRDSSVIDLLHDGEYLWLGTAGDYECAGTPPTLGLVRYEWKTDRVLTFLDENDSPCGLLVNGLVQLGDDVWVATDLGLSRWNRKTSKWSNYVPNAAAAAPMEEVSCPALYRRLVQTLPRSGWNEVMPAPSPYHQLAETLARLRPRAIDAATLADALFLLMLDPGTPAARAYRARDSNAVFREIARSAESGDVGAQYNLGVLYARGEGTSRDFVQAASWLRKAASSGNPQAQANLGLLLLNGARTKSEWTEARRWLTEASAQGSHYARTALLLMEHSKMPASVSE